MNDGNSPERLLFIRNDRKRLIVFSTLLHVYLQDFKLICIICLSTLDICHSSPFHEPFLSVHRNAVPYSVISSESMKLSSNDVMMRPHFDQLSFSSGHSKQSPEHESSIEVMRGNGDCQDMHLLPAK